MFIAVGWILWQHVQSNNDLVRKPIEKDFRAIWSWSTKELEGGAIKARWSFRWDGQLNQLGEAEKLAEKWGILLEETTADTYQGETKDADGHNKLTVWIHRSSQDGGTDAALTADALSDAPAELVVLLEPGPGLGYDSIIQSVATIEESVEVLDAGITGSFSVRGVPKETGSADRIAHEASAKKQEGYDDGNTSSITYFSSKLTTQVESGKKKVNLQIAQTGSSLEKNTELIIGVPLITGDYNVSD